MLPCPPAETAEINQYDLADALIDTERSQREESLDPGTAVFYIIKNIFFHDNIFNPFFDKKV